MKKHVLSTFCTLAILLVPAVAAAHVVVTPSQTGVGEHVLFNVSVPNEKEVAMRSVELSIPKGVTDVQPDVQAGWDITTTNSGGNVSSITWSGTVPVGQRADLAFKAQVPAQAGELDWKATQTYADGTVVRWSQKPSANSATPYSITKVVDDLGSRTPAVDPSATRASLALALSVAALVLSLSSLFLRRHK